MGEVYLQSRLEFLRKTQNPDGGWGYFPGKQSWMEPTVYAILALHRTPDSMATLESGWNLLKTWRLSNGSYRPNSVVADGTWVTAQAVTLAAIRGNPDESVRQSVDWLLGVRGAESSLAMRAASYFHLLKTSLDVSHTGWPWRDGNAAWIEPTAHTLVALKKVSKTYPSSELRSRVHDAETMILTRRCRDGGWNCGNPNVLNFDLPSYPETTALALLGLQGLRAEELAGPLAVAKRLCAETRSSLAKAWLTIALRTFGESWPAPPDERPGALDTMLIALEALGHPAGNFRLLQTGGVA